MTTKAPALMSVDVEDWFQVENLRGAIARDTWNERELRVEKNVELILDILAASGTKATFFTLGWVAERVPGLVKKIHSAGHEVASHGYGHDLIYNLTEDQFREDVTRSKKLLEDITGQPVIGYRAPNFSITDWAIDILRETGFKYDSSLFPSMAHDRYGKLKKFKVEDSRWFELAPGFHQVLLSCLPLGGRNLPWAGGGYFRLIPYPIFQRGVRRILRLKQAYCFYIHPWEFDPGQPRVTGIKASYRFRHYNNLERTEKRFRALVNDFSFQPIRDALAGSPALAA